MDAAVLSIFCKFSGYFFPKNFPDKFCMIFETCLLTRIISDFKSFLPYIKNIFCFYIYHSTILFFFFTLNNNIRNLYHVLP